MLRVSVLSRNNDLFIKVLSYLKSVDKFSTLSPAEDTENERNTCELCHSDPFKYAVLLSTLKNDAETLKGLKKWSDETDFDTDNVECNCPMEIACIENHDQCIQTLYDMKYRIQIPEKCQTKINQIIDINYDPHKAKRLSGIRPFVSTNGWKSIEMEDKFSDDDIVVKLLKLKACTNFHYLAAEFYEEMRKARKNQLNVTKVQKEKLI